MSVGAVTNNRGN